MSREWKVLSIYPLFIECFLFRLESTLSCRSKDSSRFPFDQISCEFILESGKRIKHGFNKIFLFLHQKCLCMFFFQYRILRDTSGGCGSARARTKLAGLARTPTNWLTSPTKAVARGSEEVTATKFLARYLPSWTDTNSFQRPALNGLDCTLTRKIPVRAPECTRRLEARGWLAGYGTGFSINHATHAISLRSESQSLGKSGGRGEGRVEFVSESREKTKNALWLVVVWLSDEKKTRIISLKVVSGNIVNKYCRAREQKSVEGCRRSEIAWNKSGNQTRRRFRIKEA